MNCSRCGDFMVAAHFLDDKDEYGERRTSSQWCVNYGHAHDSMNGQNRLTLQERRLVIPSSEPDYQHEKTFILEWSHSINSRLRETGRETTRCHPTL